MGSWLRGIRVEIDPESLLPQHKHFVLQFRLAGTISTNQVQALLHLGGTMLLVAEQRDVGQWTREIPVSLGSSTSTA